MTSQISIGSSVMAAYRQENAYVYENADGCVHALICHGTLSSENTMQNVFVPFWFTNLSFVMATLSIGMSCSWGLFHYHGLT